MELSGRTALVTGAARRVGRSIATALGEARRRVDAAACLLASAVEEVGG